MGKHVKVAIGILIVGMIGITIGKFALPLLRDQEQAGTSDARDTKGKISIGYDNWIGYFPLCSPEMKKRMRQSGYLLECKEDGADYIKRFAALASAELDFAVATVDSYLLNAAADNYPGVIVAVIDESKGGDAIVAWEEKLKSLDDFKIPQALKIAFTPGSPSDHLLKAIAVHFDIPVLRQRQGWPLKTQGSDEALKLLLDKQVDAAVLWEPDVSKALQKKGIKRIIGTEDTNQLIVDILLVNRKLTAKNPDLVEILLNHYFKTLKYYRDNPARLIEDIAAQYNLDKDAVTALLNGVEWASLTDNAQHWFGLDSVSLPEEALIDTIESSINILIEYGDIKQNPLPNNDPFRITNSQFLASSHKHFMGVQVFNQPGAKNSEDPIDSLAKPFLPLNDQSWQQLREIGTLKIRPIIFASGSHELTLEGKRQLDEAAGNLKHYPNYRLEIRGHTGLRGNVEQNKALSLDRAEAVQRYLNITYGLDAHRMRAIGLGGDKPLSRHNGESERAYYYRLPRVELVLMAEEF